MAPIPRAFLANLLPRISAETSILAERISKRIPHPRPSLSRAAELLRRQSNGGTAVIPSVYKVDGPAPGAVAGIVLGSIAGFILLILLFFFLSGNRPGLTITGETEDIAIVRRDERSSRGHRRSRRSDRSERIDMRERSPRTRTTIVEETRRTSDRRPPSIVSERVVESRRGSRGPPPPRRVDGDDIVEVIEEGSSISEMPPRRDDRRRRSSGGYRSVDPSRYAGGDYPQIKVPKSSSRRYR